MARPRDPSVEPRILQAVRELLADGYDALTMEAVANRAGVGKPTVYRRWATRAQLVFELLTTPSVPEALADTGTLEQDLILTAGWLGRSLAESDRKLLGDRIGEMIENGGFARRVTERQLAPERDVLFPLWERAVVRGEVAPGVDGLAVLDDLIGVLTYRVLIRHEHLDDVSVAELVRRHLPAVIRDRVEHAGV